MRFQLNLYNINDEKHEIPLNYQYPLSAAIYRILSKGDAAYADFLHEEGYGKGYKFFTFSDLDLKFKRREDRMQLLSPNIELKVCFHIPEASRTFVEGLFKSEEIVIADKKSRARFVVQSVLSKPQPLKGYAENEIVSIIAKPLSPIVSGEKQENGNYEFLEPNNPRFIDSLFYSWRNKIAAAYDEETAKQAILLAEVETYKNPWRSRLITIKADTQAETKIRGFINFKLKLTAEKRFLDLVLNAGMGLYSAQGMGCLGVVDGMIE